MGIGFVYASDRDREREKVFGVEALAGEMMMMKMKFTDIVFGVKKMTNVSSKNHHGSGVFYGCLVLRLNLLFTEFQFFFFLLKLSAVCTFWIVLMCWCQKWFLKNKKTSLACISARKAIWKATTTTLPNTQHNHTNKSTTL